MNLLTFVIKHQLLLHVYAAFINTQTEEDLKIELCF